MAIRETSRTTQFTTKKTAMTTTTMRRSRSTVGLRVPRPPGVQCLHGGDAFRTDAQAVAADQMARTVHHRPTSTDRDLDDASVFGRRPRIGRSWRGTDDDDVEKTENKIAGGQLVNPTAIACIGDIYCNSRTVNNRLWIVTDKNRKKSYRIEEQEGRVLAHADKTPTAVWLPVLVVHARRQAAAAIVVALFFALYILIPNLWSWSLSWTSSGQFFGNGDIFTTYPWENL